MSDCIFCAIAAGSVERRLVAERLEALAFLPRDELAPGHTLVIPRAHATDMFDVEEPDFVATMQLVRDVSEAMVVGLGAHGVNVLHASGAAAEQSVFHLHFHVVPRWSNDGFSTWPAGRSNRGPIAGVHDFLRAHIG